MLRSWSISRLHEFEKCKFKVYLKSVQHVAEPERPLPPGKLEHANDRGSRVHDNCEQYVRGDIDDLCPEAEKHFGIQIDMLRTLYADNLVSLEGEWGVDREWCPTSWKEAWHRSKLDVLVFFGDRRSTSEKVRDKLLEKSFTEAVVIDYKTGKRFGNEIKHGEQMQLYLLNSFLRFPHLEVVTSELWYLDLGEVARQTMTRAQALRFKSNFDRRGNAVTTEIDFKPSPNKFSCKWCMYGNHNGGTGHCKVGVGS